MTVDDLHLSLFCLEGVFMNCAPVLLINFNRPDFTARQIAVLRHVRPKQVFFAVDGPREARQEDMSRVTAVRSLVSSIDWQCEVKTLFQDRNLGCKYAPPAAVTWFFENVEEGIVLEDDVDASEDFFHFATDLLEYYRNDERVGAIAGFNRYNLQTDEGVSYHFNRHLDVWGWASWRRVWCHYEIDMASYFANREEIVKRSLMTSRGRRMFLLGVEAVRNGFQTWDYQFALMFMARGYVSAVPRLRLVCNRGINDARGTNTCGYNFDHHHYTNRGAVEGRITHPMTVAADEKAMVDEEHREFAIFPRALTWLGSKIPSLVSLCDMIGRALERSVPCLFRL